MHGSSRLIAASAVAALVLVSIAAGVGLAAAPPVGPLPAGPTSTINTHKGELVAFALPARSGGRVWRVARAFDSKVLQQVSEANVGNSVVLVFKAAGTGTSTVSFGLTRGERTKAYEARHYAVHVR
jgi:hypothetical protein